MKVPTHTSYPARFTVAVALVVGALMLMGCGSSKRDKPATETTAAPEDVVVSDAAVATGFAELIPQAATTAQKVAAKAPDAKAAVTRMYDTWFTFEGTVRKKEQSLYLDLEDALVAIKAGQEQGDGTKALDGAATVASLAATYLEAHPGDGSSDETVPTVAAGPSRDVGVALNEWAIDVPATLDAGNTTFVMENTGKETHEFVIFRTDLAPGALQLDAEGGVDEKGPGVTLVDEKENIKPGTTAKLRVELTPGNYVFVCNLLNHYKDGMVKQVSVK